MKTHAMTGDLVERLRAACDGHPHAKIAWPHRILHESAATIERLEADIAIKERAIAEASRSIHKLMTRAVAAEKSLESERALRTQAEQEHTDMMWQRRRAEEESTRLLAERNEAFERAAKVADDLAAEADRFASQAHAEGSEGTAYYASERAEHYRESATAIRQLKEQQG